MARGKGGGRMVVSSARRYYVEEDYNCAESVLLAANEVYGLGIDPQSCVRLLGAFGGGVGCGSLCGALAGSLAALGAGMMAGRAHTTEGLKERCADFVEGFEAALASRECREIKPRRFVEDGERCFDTVRIACELLEMELDALRA